jgi:acetate kinase
VIEEFTRRFPGVPHVACFDTTFHRTLPRVAYLLPIPRRYEAAGVRKYGFHGLSYQYLMTELARQVGDAGAQGRVILAHLGNGASMAAVRDGRCMETTMGFTPAAGLVMGTRTGDLDPGLVAFFARTEAMTPDQFDAMANHQSGLLGVSETSSDMRDLIASRAADPRAAEAVSLLCYTARRWIGSLAAVLGGLETLVFSGGIGEHSAEVRAEICQGLEFLGVTVDPARNRRHDSVISEEGSRAAVRVIPTDEEVTIARDVLRFVSDHPV